MTKDCFNCKFGDVALCNEPCKTCKFNPTDPPTHWQAPDCLACAALRAENERLKAEVERLQISEVEQIARNISEMRAIQVRAENERLCKVLRMSRPYLLYADTAHEPPKELIAEIDEALKGGDE